MFVYSGWTTASVALKLIPWGPLFGPCQNLEKTVNLSKLKVDQVKDRHARCICNTFVVGSVTVWRIRYKWGEKTKVVRWREGLHMTSLCMEVWTLTAEIQDAAEYWINTRTPLLPPQTSSLSHLLERSCFWRWVHTRSYAASKAAWVV